MDETAREGFPAKEPFTVRLEHELAKRVRKDARSLNQPYGQYLGDIIRQHYGWTMIPVLRDESEDDA